MRRPLAQRPVERVEPDEDVAHLRDRVDAEVGPRAVRGAPVRLDLEGDEALVGDADAHPGRLGDDRRVGADALQHRLRPDRRELLVDDRGDDHVAAQPAPRRLGRRDQARRQAALHVVGAAPVEPPRLHARARAGRPSPPYPTVSRCAFRSSVSPAARPARGRDHVRPAGRRLVELDLEPGVRAPTRRRTRRSPPPPARRARG